MKTKKKKRDNKTMKEEKKEILKLVIRKMLNIYYLCNAFTK